VLLLDGTAEAFCAPLNDPRDVLGALWRHICSCFGDWCRPTTAALKYFAPYTALVQSSCMGKSRYLAELGKNHTRVLYLCLRAGHEGYPARADITDWLLSPYADVPASAPGAAAAAGAAGAAGAAPTGVRVRATAADVQRRYVAVVLALLDAGMDDALPPHATLMLAWGTREWDALKAKALELALSSDARAVKLAALRARAAGASATEPAMVLALDEAGSLVRFRIDDGAAGTTGFRLMRRALKCASACAPQRVNGCHMLRAI